MFDGGRCVVVDYNRCVNARLILLAMAAVLLASCLPKPGKSIEWLHREDSVIVQMRSLGGDSMIASVDLDRAPSFTLYGDGTLIVSEATKDCGTVSDPCSTRLLRSRLSDDDIEGLLHFIDGTGFLNFRYEQPVPPVSGSATVYIYVNTKLAANAVRAYALGWEQSGQAWSEFRKLGTINQRLQDLRENAIGTSTPFAPMEGELEIGPLMADDLIGAPAWPFPQFDISTATPGEGGAGHLRLSSDKLEELRLTDTSTTQCWCPVQQAGRAFNVIYRPALPYEENFPEFDNG